MQNGGLCLSSSLIIPRPSSTKHMPRTPAFTMILCGTQLVGLPEYQCYDQCTFYVKPHSKKVPNPHKRFCLLKRAIKLRWLEKQNEKKNSRVGNCVRFPPYTQETFITAAARRFSIRWNRPPCYQTSRSAEDRREATFWGFVVVFILIIVWKRAV